MFPGWSLSQSGEAGKAAAASGWLGTARQDWQLNSSFWCVCVCLRVLLTTKQQGLNTWWFYTRLGKSKPSNGSLNLPEPRCGACWFCCVSTDVLANHSFLLRHLYTFVLWYSPLLPLRHTGPGAVAALSPQTQHNNMAAAAKTFTLDECKKHSDDKVCLAAAQVQLSTARPLSCSSKRSN